MRVPPELPPAAWRQPPSTLALSPHKRRGSFSPRVVSHPCTHLGTMSQEELQNSVTLSIRGHRRDVSPRERAAPPSPPRLRHRLALALPSAWATPHLRVAKSSALKTFASNTVAPPQTLTPAVQTRFVDAANDMIMAGHSATFRASTVIGLMSDDVQVCVPRLFSSLPKP